MDREFLERAARMFHPTSHMRNFNEGEWVALYDNHGKALPGIRGKRGVANFTLDDHELGIDLMEMAPGSAFPLHIHPGDHILAGLEGRVHVHVDGTDYEMGKGDTVFIPGEYPHGVRTIPGETTLATFLAIGHNHKDLEAHDRMKLVEEPEV